MQEQNNILNETLMCKEMLNGSDNSALQNPSRGSSQPSWILGKWESHEFWMESGWNINTFAFNKDMFLKTTGINVLRWQVKS